LTQHSVAVSRQASEGTGVEAREKSRESAKKVEQVWSSDERSSQEALGEVRRGEARREESNRMVLRCGKCGRESSEAYQEQEDAWSIALDQLSVISLPLEDFFPDIVNNNKTLPPSSVFLSHRAHRSYIHVHMCLHVRTFICH
jgi:hypothetical protein